MKSSDLESLIAYLDDELGEEDRQAVQARIETDTRLAQALAGLRAGDAALLRSLQQADDDAGRDRITRKVAALLAEASAGRGRRQPSRSRMLPITASVAALAIGIGLGLLASNQRFEARLARLETAQVNDSRAIERVVTQALEKHLSGQSVRWQSVETGKHVVVTPVRTYRAQSGKWCREFTREIVSTEGREALRGIACRDLDGVWRPQLWRPIATPS